MIFSWSAPEVRLSVSIDGRGAVLEMGIVVTGGRWRFERMVLEDEAEAAEKFSILLRWLQGGGR